MHKRVSVFLGEWDRISSKSEFSWNRHIIAIRSWETFPLSPRFCELYRTVICNFNNFCTRPKSGSLLLTKYYDVSFVSSWTKFSLSAVFVTRSRLQIDSEIIYGRSWIGSEIAKHLYTVNLWVGLTCHRNWERGYVCGVFRHECC